MGSDRYSTRPAVEIVLSELVANFAFELSDTPVVWNMSGITYPSVSVESTKSELWMKVRRLSKVRHDSGEKI